MRVNCIYAACLFVSVGVILFFILTIEPSTAYDMRSPDRVAEEAAVERACKLVDTLDDVYKQTIVLITDKYVHTKDDFPAGRAAVQLFSKISKTGTHQVRLIDATGEPYDPANVANTAFEKEGIQRLKVGATFYDEVIEQDGKRQLQAITPVPVVMQKCVLCHAHYADAKKGEPIGAISYLVPIE
ncbi:MAG: DUF3365 domain-containing protein [Planctomycetota bacterium]